MTERISTRVGALPPPVPPKSDIIPIHTSDRANFKHCRRYWDWASPARSNLRQKQSIYGINLPMWFGTGVHLALELFYDPTFSRDPVESFRTWWEYQTKGGFVPALHHRFAKGLPITWQDNKTLMCRVTGLLDLLPDPSLEELEIHLELGVGMLTFYKEYANVHDNFAVIAAEHDFSIPLLHENGKPVQQTFYLEEDAGAYYKPVHYRGRLDVIIQDLESGRYGVMDHKTAAKAEGEQYVRKLEKDEQVTSYMWAAEREAEMYDLEYKKIDFTLYNTLWKGFPRPPSITAATKNFPQGRPSIDRNQMTTAGLWYTAVKERGLDWWVETDEKAQAYAQYLLDAGDGMFVRRDLVRRNRFEIESCGSRILDEVHDMLAPDIRVYPNPTSNYRCLGCAFRNPCVAKDDGGDWQQMIEDGYESNYDR